MRILIAALMILTIIPQTLASGPTTGICPKDKPNHRMILKYTPETLCSNKPCTGRIICMENISEATCYRENCIPCKQSETQDICLSNQELKNANRK
jgi:hypothetical protein